MRGSCLQTGGVGGGGHSPPLVPRRLVRVWRRCGQRPLPSGLRPTSPSPQVSAGQGEKYTRLELQRRYRGDALEALCGMTPFCRKAPHERKAALRRAADAADAADTAAAADAAADAAAAAGGGADGGGGLDVTLDVITSTHRVWLGTGGFAECPEALY